MMTEAETQVEIAPTINGDRRTLRVSTNLMLADLLRDRLGLKGCKIACDAGVCGACTVLMNQQPVAACSMFAFETDGADIVTIEGVGTNGLDPIQLAFLRGDAFQCGYCTPGMILSTKALLANVADPSESEIRELLGGNLCRCTGYQMIIEAVRAAAASLRGSDTQ